MVNLIQTFTVQQAYDEITHARRWASWNWWWRMVDDDDGDESPSLQPRTDSRSALPREIKAWWRLRIVKRDETSSLIFLPAKRNIWSWSWGRRSCRGATTQGAHPEGVGAPPPSWTGCGPPDLHLLPAFFIFSETYLRGFLGHSENFCFLHIKQHHGNSAENSISPG